MKNNVQGKPKRERFKDWIILVIVFVVAIILLVIFPERKTAVITTSWRFLLEMLLILPAVMVLIGLFSVFVPKEKIGQYLGKTSGIRGVLFALFLGTLPTGSLYIAFPIAQELLRKGARISNIIIFLSAWACIKIPQELVELQFLGLTFTASRLLLTIIFVTIMGLFIEWIIGMSRKGGNDNASL